MPPPSPTQEDVRADEADIGFWNVGALPRVPPPRRADPPWTDIRRNDAAGPATAIDGLLGWSPPVPPAGAS